MNEKVDALSRQGAQGEATAPASQLRPNLHLSPEFALLQTTAMILKKQVAAKAEVVFNPDGSIHVRGYEGRVVPAAENDDTCKCCISGSNMFEIKEILQKIESHIRHIANMVS